MNEPCGLFEDTSYEAWDKTTGPTWFSGENMWNKTGSARSQVFQTNTSPKSCPRMSNVKTIYHTPWSYRSTCQEAFPKIKGVSQPSIFQGTILVSGRVDFPNAGRCPYFPSCFLELRIHPNPQCYPHRTMKGRLAVKTPQFTSRNRLLSVGDFKPWMKTKHPWCPQIFKNNSPK